MFSGALRAADAATGSLLFQAIEAEIREAAQASATRDDIKLILQESKDDLHRYVDLCKEALGKYVGELKGEMDQYAVDALLNFNLLGNLT